MSNRKDDIVLSRRRVKRRYEEEDSFDSNHNNKSGSSNSSSDPRGGSRQSRNVSNRKTSSTTNTTATAVTAENSQQVQEEGCVICKQDNDHANLLLCEGCDAESHIYCLNPPLLAVPEGDWFCAKCVPDDGSDNLDELVRALPIDYSCRFNDICWSQGGVGYGWWPACIFNPCLAIGAARTQAKKNLGRRHLVYFFYCAEAPFEIKSDSAIMSWEMGLSLGYHMGRTAYAHGKRRYKQFQLALQAASIEESVPKHHRLKWTFTDEPERISGKNGGTATSRNQNRRGNNSSGGGSDSNNNKSTSNDVPSSSSSNSGKRKRSHGNAFDTESSARSRHSSGSARDKIDGKALEEPSEREQLVCHVMRRLEEDDDAIPIGIIVLPSRKRATFADVRRCIRQELTSLPVEWAWRFWVPGSGPVSTRRESKCGNMLSFLWSNGPSRAVIGEGTIDDPVNVILVDAPKV